MTNGFLTGKVYNLKDRTILGKWGKKQYSFLGDGHILKTNYVKPYQKTRTGFKAGEQSCNFKLKLMELLFFCFL